MAGAQLLGDFGIGEGGLLRRFESATRLTTLRRQIVTAVLVTFVPVVVFGLVYERITGVREPLIHDPSMYVRLLVAAPVFLFLDQMFPPVCRRALQQLVEESYVPEAQQPRFDRVIASARRLADSPLPELLLALVGLGLGVCALFGIVPASGLIHRSGVTAAQLWYALTDWPFFQFLLWRSLWRWAIWVRILVGVSRLELDLVAVHADRRGGISFLRLPSVGYCAVLLFAISSVLCAEWGVKIEIGVSLLSFKPFLIVLGTVGTLIAFGPLLLFAPRLWRVRREGLIECARVATEYGRCFGRSRLDGRGGQGVLQAGETQPLSDLALIYRDTVARLRVVLFDGRDLILLLAATLFPVLCVMLVRVPFDEWRFLIGVVTGGRL